jgi:hypothetical protein
MKWAKFKAYWEELGSPKLEYRDIAGQGEWEILNQYPHFCVGSDYRIAGDRHHELRLKWINSDKVLPIEFREIDCNWYLINTDLADVYWYQSFDYREAPVEEITITNVASEKDPGAHYRHLYTVKLNQSDIERGSVTIMLDPYRIAHVYNMTDHMEFSVLKKILRLGTAHKDKRQDLHDIINAAQRRLEILDEDEAR